MNFCGSRSTLYKAYALIQRAYVYIQMYVCAYARPKNGDWNFPPRKFPPRGEKPQRRRIPGGKNRGGTKGWKLPGGNGPSTVFDIYDEDKDAYIYKIPVNLL